MRVVAAILEAGDRRVLLAQRPVGKQHAGLWEFPGGKVEPGESGFAALQRELREELDIEIGSAVRFMTVRQERAFGPLELEAWRVRAWHGTPTAREHAALAWQVPVEPLPLKLCEADWPIWQALALPQAYAITPAPENDDAAFFERIESGLKRGVRLLQWRAPNLEASRYRHLAMALIDLAHAHRARLLLNADPVLALELGADGVHLSAARTRALAQLPGRGADMLVAASVHDSEELAQAERLGVDFVVISPIRPTASHPERAGIGWQGFETILKQSDRPAYALGGMGLDDVDTALRHGALGIAGISAFW